MIPYASTLSHSATLRTSLTHEPREMTEKLKSLPALAEDTD